MKIGDFCALFQLPHSVVRYYIHVGILVPSLKNKQYVFTDACVSDMRFVQQLKDYRFSLSEIHEILSQYRISNFAAEADLKKLRELFVRKRVELERKAAQAEQALQALAQMEAVLRREEVPAHDDS